MAKNRAQLDEEAKELGIDPSAFETNAQVQVAIDAKKADAESQDTGDRPVNTDTDAENPQDDQEDIKAPMESTEQEEEDVDGVKVKTTKVVRFQVNGETFEGTEFVFPEEVAEARKQMLVERYGAGVIEQ